MKSKERDWVGKSASVWVWVGVLVGTACCGGCFAYSVYFSTSCLVREFVMISRKEIQSIIKVLIRSMFSAHV